MNSKIQNDDGFTIIEAMVALGIFSICFLAIGAMQINGINKTTHSREMTEAMIAAENQAESLMAMKFYLDDNGIDDDNNGDIDFYDVNPDLVAGQYQENSAWTGKYTVNWSVIDDIPLPAVNGPAPFALTRSKSITLWVTPDDNPNKILINMQFVKVGVLSTGDKA